MTTRWIRLSAGPDWAKPIESERVLEDGSKAQGFETRTGGLVVRRTCAPKDRKPGTPSVYWEVEYHGSVMSR